MLSTTVLSVAQSKQDHTWIFGGDNPNFEPGLGNQYNFSSDGLTFTTVNLGSEVFRTVSLMSDKETGELLFYSNGCKVFNRNHELMLNGDDINNVTDQWSFYCGLGFGYPGNNNTMTLPDPANLNGYYIIHKPLTLIEEPILDAFTETVNYTYVDMELDNGLGGVIAKNIVLEERRTEWGHLQACKHANGKDWWITQILNDENIFLIYLLDENGISLVNEITEGPVLLANDGVATQVTFSRDGSKFFIHNPLNELLIYDFERETGEIIFREQIHLTEENRARAVCVSPNNQYLYASTRTRLFQFDLLNDDIESSKVLIDTFLRLPNSQVPSQFGYMLPGPDCKIYLTSPAGTTYQHVIHSPDLPGKDCDFEQHGVNSPNPMPALFSFVFPYFRMDEEHPCDPTLVGLADLYGTDRDQISIFPNPVSSLLTISQEIDLDIERYMIYTLSGQQIMSGAVSGLDLTIDVSRLDKGMYILQVVDDEGEMLASKFVRE